MLDNMSGTLNEHLMQPWFSSPVWKPLKVPVAQLADSMHKYAVYLNEKNSIVQTNHSMLEPVRSPSDAESFCLVDKASWVRPTLVRQYSELEEYVSSLDEFTPVFLNDFAPVEVRKRRVYIDGLKRLPACTQGC